jgi:3-dehydroquinate synthase
MKSLKISSRFSQTSEVYVGFQAIQQLSEWLRKKKFQRLFLIVDKNLERFFPVLQDKISMHLITVEAGEGLKNFFEVQKIFDILLQQGADRKDAIIAWGGGSVGDVAGFVASTYFRGIPWINIPSTLLSQVDSGIGGKTGIHFSNVKNAIGSFYPPLLVLCDTEFLVSLSSREIISGLGEIVKCSLLRGSSFYEMIQNDKEKILQEGYEKMEDFIYRSLKYKASLVALDPWDERSKRVFLNFGHTLGHALEAATEYQIFRHGEAVLLGMRFALALSEVKKKITYQRSKILDEFLSFLKVPSIPKTVSWESLMFYMQKDKKKQGNSLFFVLLKDVGHPLFERVYPSELEEAYGLFCERL